MKRKILSFFLAVLSALLLSGCAMATVEEMYALPKRSDEYSQLQTAIDSAMRGLDYSAPISGEHQQTVQTADLDGDGEEEYLVFASGSWENPLQVLIFKQRTDGTCDLVDIIESNGAAFEQVEYVSFDDQPGQEIVIGTRVSDQVLRSVSVYSMNEGRIQQLLLVGYSRFLTYDFDGNDISELMVLRPGETEVDSGVSVLYSFRDGKIQRSEEETLSASSHQIRRVRTGMLSDGSNGVFVSSETSNGKIMTDILVMAQGHLRNIASAEDEQQHNFYVYPEDIDEDGVMELPAPLSIRPVSVWSNDEEESLLRWFSTDPQGNEEDKLFTFHNFQEGWYLSLDSDWAQQISVVQGQEEFSFYTWNSDFSEATALFSIYTLSGSNRNEAATAEGMLLLHSTESVIYAAKLESQAAAYAITREKLTESFRLIRQDWRMN